MIRVGVSTVVMWFLGMAAAGAGPAGLRELVDELDAMRLPGGSLAAQVEVRGSGSDGRFELRARRRDDGCFDVLMVAGAPARDAGKRLLFRGAEVWLHDPRARRPTKLSAQQLWSEGALADSLGWSLARDFGAVELASERLAVEGGGPGPLCRVIELRPRGEVRKAAGPMRWWVDERGRPRQVVHLTASGRAWRTIHFVEFQRLMGRDRPTKVRVQSRGKTCEVTTTGMRAAEVPAEWVAPESFAAAQVK